MHLGTLAAGRLSEESHACPSFFFSSRRRHTRCYRDWSSDVCSSDLCSAAKGAEYFSTARYSWPCTSSFSATRSEERRVGKECRSRWSPDHQEEKGHTSAIADSPMQSPRLTNDNHHVTQHSSLPLRRR